MGVMDPSLAKPIPPGADQDAILNAVGEEITNRGFVIAKADKLFNWARSGSLVANDIWSCLLRRGNDAFGGKPL